MASAAKSAYRTAARQLRGPCLYGPRLSRPFSSSRSVLAEDKAPSGSESYFNRAFYSKLDRDDRSVYDTLSPAERQQMEQVDGALRDEFAKDSRAHRELEDSIAAELESLDLEFPAGPAERAPRNNGFFQMGEKEDIGPDEDDFKGDDISSTGHGELEQTREIREYARLAGWEMPLLASEFVQTPHVKEKVN